MKPKKLLNLTEVYDHIEFLSKADITNEEQEAKHKLWKRLEPEVCFFFLFLFFFCEWCL